MAKTAKHWHTGHCAAGTPVFLPDQTAGVYTTLEDARGTLADDLEHAAFLLDSPIGDHNCNELQTRHHGLPCPTYGAHCAWQLAQEYRYARRNLLSSNPAAHEWEHTTRDGQTYWVVPCSGSLCTVPSYSYS